GQAYCSYLPRRARHDRPALRLCEPDASGVELERRRFARFETPARDLVQLADKALVLLEQLQSKVGSSSAVECARYGEFDDALNVGGAGARGVDLCLRPGDAVPALAAGLEELLDAHAQVERGVAIRRAREPWPGLRDDLGVVHQQDARPREVASRLPDAQV